MKRKKFTFYKGYADAAEEIKEEFGVKAAVDFFGSGLRLLFRRQRTDRSIYLRVVFKG